MGADELERQSLPVLIERVATSKMLRPAPGQLGDGLGPAEAALAEGGFVVLPPETVDAVGALVVRLRELGLDQLDQLTRVPWNDRGFDVYGDRVVCSYGTVIRVTESSAAEAAHAWLRLDANPSIDTGEGAAHLDRRQALNVAARLLAWAEDHP